MKNLFFLFFMFLIASQAIAEEEAYIIDRRGFKNAPTKACVHIFKASHYLRSSCQSVGIPNRRISRTGIKEYQDFIYFYKIDKDLLKNSGELLFITSYRSNNKSLSLSTFQNLNDSNLIIVSPNSSTSLANQKNKLQSEIDELKISHTQIRSKLDSNLFNEEEGNVNGSKLNDLIKIVQIIHKIKFLDEELNILTEKNQRIISFSGANLKKLNSDKAKLSKILKSTIESSLGSN